MRWNAKQEQDDDDAADVADVAEVGQWRNKKTYVTILPIQMSCTWMLFCVLFQCVLGNSVERRFHGQRHWSDFNENRPQLIYFGSAICAMDSAVNIDVVSTHPLSSWLAPTTPINAYAVLMYSSPIL